MKFNVRTLAIAGLAGIALTLTGCASNATSAGSPETASKGALAMSFPSPSAVAIWSDVLEKMGPLVESEGYELVTDDPANNAQTQASNWQTWIQRGDVKAIMGYPVQSAALVPVTQQADAAGIPVVGYAAPWEGTAANLLSDGHADGAVLGKAAGEWILKKYGNSTAVPVTLLGYWDNEFGSARSEGIADGLKSSGANVVINEASAVTLEEGHAAVQNALSAQPGTKVWLSIGSDPALGAYQALLDSGLAADEADTLLGAMDVSDQVLDTISQPGSFWRFSYAASAQELAEISAELLINAAEGTLDGDVTVKTQRVTAENAAAFRSGK